MGTYELEHANWRINKDNPKGMESANVEKRIYMIWGRGKKLKKKQKMMIEIYAISYYESLLLYGQY